MRRLAIIGVLLFPVCIGINGYAQTAAQKAKSSEAEKAQKMRWDDPRKGKIWGKVNVVQIPLTAYENHILGSVRAVSYKDYKISHPGGAYQQDVVDSGLNEYDRSGHLVSQKEFKANGTAKWICSYSYDGKKATEFNFKFEDAKKNSKTVFKYDDKGNEIESTIYDDNGNIIGKGTKKYDEKGNVVDEANYDGNGKLKQMETYKYGGPRNFQTEWKKTDGDGKLVWKLVCEYDTAGNKTSCESYKSEKESPSRWTENNDDKKKEIEHISYSSNGGIESKIVTAYDVYGNTLEYNVYKADGSLNEDATSIYDIAYDKTGNVVKEVEFKMKDGKRTMIRYTQMFVSYY